jgi:hypothetical protein
MRVGDICSESDVEDAYRWYLLLRRQCISDWTGLLMDLCRVVMQYEPIVSLGEVLLGYDRLPMFYKLSSLDRWNMETSASCPSILSILTLERSRILSNPDYLSSFNREHGKLLKWMDIYVRPPPDYFWIKGLFARLLTLHDTAKWFEDNRDALTKRTNSVFQCCCPGYFNAPDITIEQVIHSKDLLNDFWSLVHNCLAALSN